MTKRYTEHADLTAARRARQAVHDELDRRDPSWRQPTHIGAAVQRLIDQGHIRAESLNAREEVQVRKHPADATKHVVIHTRRSLQTSKTGDADRDFRTAQDVPDGDWIARARPDREADEAEPTREVSR